MSQEAVQAVRDWMRQQELDAFMVTQLQNRTYLSGWFNEDNEGSGFLLIGQDQQMLLTHSLYQEVAQKEAPDWELVLMQRQGVPPQVVSLAQQHSWKTIGFESEAISFAEYERFHQAGEGVFTLRPYEQSVIEDLRVVKQPYEIELLKRAVEITDRTFTHICEWIQPGMSEREVALEISNTFSSLGADGLAFDSIVASGPNGSMPHHHPGEREIGRGELITIDMGARYHGYCADMTRTICLGEPAEPRMREYYDLVLRAMKTCEAGIHAGISGRDADALARQVLTEAGLAEYFVHSTGHGMGLQIHEKPNLSNRSPEEMVLPANAVVTIEPGVYIPDWSGLRIEDCGVVGEHGLQVLTQSPTELVIQK